MKKDSLKDFATAAFVRYARRGKPSHEEFVKRNDPNTEKTTSALADIDAINRMFSELERQDKGYISDAVRAIYMCYPYNMPSNEQMYQRVLAHSISVPADVSTIYRWLKYARELYASCRGLEFGD